MKSLMRAFAATALMLLVAGAAAASAETRPAFELVNAKQQRVRIAPFGDGWLIALSIPGLPVEQLNRLEPVFVVSSHGRPDESVSAMFGDAVFDWFNLLQRPEGMAPPASGKADLCVMWPDYPADEGCEDLPPVRVWTIYRRIPAHGRPQIEQLGARLRAAQMLRVAYLTVEGRDHAVFGPADGLQAAARNLP